MSSSLAKLATAITVVIGGVADARYTRNYHPLLEAPTEVESIAHETGGFSMKLHKTPVRQNRSRLEQEAMKKQRQTIARIEEKKRNSWTHSARKWLGLTAANMIESEMPVINYIDQTYAVRITANEVPNPMWAIVDSGLAFTVLETDACANCGASLVSGANLNKAAGSSVDSGTVVSGRLNNPQVTYTGTKGTSTVCIFDSSAGYSAPTAANRGTMPCAPNMPVHFADTVPTANDYANAYLGMALGEGEDHWGTTPDSTDLIMNNFLSATRVDAASKKFAIALATDDGNGLVEASTLSYMDLGAYTTSAGSLSGSKGTIQFQSGNYYWKTTLDGIRFGGKLSGSYGLNNAEISIDSGLQCLYVPEDTYEFVYNTLLDYSTGYYNTGDGETIVDCGDSQVMQNIQLLVNGMWVEIAQNDYLNVVTTQYNGASASTGACRLCVKQSWDRDWHMGTLGMIGYYTEFDFTNRQVSFQPLASGTKLEVVAGAKPDRILGINWVTVILLSSGIAFTWAMFIFLLMAVYCDFNIFSRLFPGGSQAKRKTSSAQIEGSNEISMEHLENLIENALLRKSNKSGGQQAEDNLFTINALV